MSSLDLCEETAHHEMGLQLEQGHDVHSTCCRFVKIYCGFLFSLISPCFKVRECDHTCNRRSTCNRHSVVHRNNSVPMMVPTSMLPEVLFQPHANGFPSNQLAPMFVFATLCSMAWKWFIQVRLQVVQNQTHEVAG